MSHPINMNIEASDYCRLGDTLTFNTSKTTYAWKPTLFKIDYGDGKIITTTKKEDITLLKRKYPTEGSFKVGIFSKDSTGCERSDTVRLNLELPVFNKINAGPICANQEFSLKSSRGRKITDISWEINNVKKINPFALKDSLSYRYWDTLHILSTAGTLYTIKQLLKYNTTCTWIDSVQSYVFPEFAIDLSIKGLCANENSVFKAVRAKGNLDVLEWNWLIKKRTNTLPYDTTLIYQAKSTIPSKVDSVFLTPKEGLAMVSVVAKNRYGCVFKKALNQQIIEMPKPCVTVSDYCANKLISLNWDCTKFNSFVNESIWDFGDNSPVLKLLGKATPEHIYPNVVKNTVYTTKLTLVNKEYNCSKDTTFAIKVLASPKGNFEIKDTCVGQDVKLIDKSVSASNDKNNLTWHLGNGKIVSNESIVSHDYGDSIKSYKPFLVVENSATGCRDTVRKEFTMRPQPKANFTFDKLNSIANKPILFKDSSSAFVRFWNYEFNDDLSSSSTEKNPKFTYNKGGIFNVKQTVQTLFGCKDEITKQINLFPYFTLPTVFSPNDDGINDVFFPIYQNIGEYKMVIFNRWGEEIFTTSSLDEGWNGTFKDEKMPFGVYIYYIKAKTLLGDDLIYEGKVTLIR